MNSSLYIGASGMKSLSEGMNIVSNNIANSSTIAYKQQTIQFADSYYSELGSIGESLDSQTGSYVGFSQTGTGVQVGSVLSNFTQGDLESSTSVTSLALSGKGYFQVQSQNGKTYYTRAGDFYTDDSGTLINSSNMYVMGYKLNTDGSLGALSQINLSKSTTMDPKATSSMSLRFNLAQSTDNSTDVDDPYFSLLKQYDSSSTPPLSTSAYGYSQSITYYDSSGVSHSATMYFDGAPTTDGTGSTVEYLIATDADDNGGTAQAVMSGTLSFNSSGTLTDMSAYTPDTQGSTALADWATASLSSSGLPQMNLGGSTVTLDLGISSTSGWENVTNTAADVGTDQSLLSSIKTNATVTTDATTNYTTSSATTKSKSQDGYAEGTLSSISIGTDGTITGKFSNNETQDLYQIPVCRFTNEDGLRREGSNLYSYTSEAGTMEMGKAGTENYGKVTSYSTETSNVDLATEMTNMIITQRGFQSNSKVVTTADEMLQKAMDMKRS